MQATDISQIIIDIINDITDEEVTVDDIKPDVRLRDQLDLDSMDFLDIVMELRKRHQIEVPEEDYPKLASLASCQEYLGPKLAAK